MELKKEELIRIKGGSVMLKFFVIGGVVSFIIGFIDGYIRPLKCNK